MIQLSEDKKHNTIGIYDNGKFIGQITGTLVKTEKSFRDGTTEYIIMIGDEEAGYISADKKLIDA